MGARHNKSPLRHLELAPRLKRYVDAFMSSSYETLVLDLERGSETARETLRQTAQCPTERMLCAHAIVASGIPRFRLDPELYRDVLLRSEMEYAIEIEAAPDLGAHRARQIARDRAAREVDRLYESPHQGVQRLLTRLARSEIREAWKSSTQAERCWEPPAPVEVARAVVVTCAWDEFLDRPSDNIGSRNSAYVAVARRLGVSRKVVSNTFNRYGCLGCDTPLGYAQFLSAARLSQFMSALDGVAPHGISKGLPPLPAEVA